jgi:hypothetical protein
MAKEKPLPATIKLKIRLEVDRALYDKIVAQAKKEKLSGTIEDVLKRCCAKHQWDCTLCTRPTSPTRRRATMSKAFKCDLCGRYEADAPWIAIFNYPEHSEPLRPTLSKFRSTNTASGCLYEGHVAKLELCRNCRNTFYGTIIELFPEEEEQSE